MTFNFERFEYAGGSFMPKVSVRNNGSIGLSQGAVRRFGITQANRYVSLYYDRGKRVVGIRLVPEDTPGAVKLIQRSINAKDGKTSVNAFISAKSFLDYYQIDYSATRSYTAKKLDAEDLIIFDLNEPETGSHKAEGGETEPTG